jgi:plasmid maintenance system antidote protein VapI
MHLKEFLDMNHISYSGFASIIKTSKFTIHEIIHGKRLPKMELAIEIEKKTMGKVTLYDWKLNENPYKNKSKKGNKKKNKRD